MFLCISVAWKMYNINYVHFVYCHTPQYNRPLLCVCVCVCVFCPKLNCSADQFKIADCLFVLYWQLFFMFVCPCIRVSTIFCFCRLLVAIISCRLFKVVCCSEVIHRIMVGKYAAEPSCCVDWICYVLHAERHEKLHLGEFKNSGS